MNVNKNLSWNSSGLWQNYLQSSQSHNIYGNFSSEKITVSSVSGLSHSIRSGTFFHWFFTNLREVSLFLKIGRLLRHDPDVNIQAYAWRKRFPSPFLSQFSLLHLSYTLATPFAKARLSQPRPGKAILPFPGGRRLRRRHENQLLLPGQPIPVQAANRTSRR